MVDFGSAINLGFQAADDADALRAEIAVVFSILNQQIGSVTLGKIQILQGSRSADAFAALAGGLGSKVKRINIIFAKLISTGKTVELAEFNLDPKTVYPCHIEYSDVDMYCSNKESLEKALFELFSNAIVGKKIKQLMQGTI